MSTAAALDLTVDDAIVLHDSNRLAVRLRPCDVLARVAPRAHEAAKLEVELAKRLAETECPVAGLEPRVAPRVYGRDGFVITFWTYHEPVSPRGSHQPPIRMPLSGFMPACGTWMSRRRTSRIGSRRRNNSSRVPTTLPRSPTRTGNF